MTEKKKRSTKKMTAEDVLIALRCTIAEQRVAELAKEVVNLRTDNMVLRRTLALKDEEAKLSHATIAHLQKRVVQVVGDTFKVDVSTLPPEAALFDVAQAVSEKGYEPGMKLVEKKEQ